MIYCQLMGGLGNMMFQIAAIEDMGRRSGLETCYLNVDERLKYLMNSSSHSEYAMDYPKIFKNFDWYKNSDKPVEIRDIIKVPHKFVDIIPVDDNCYIGYFQSERYFDREETLKLFEPADSIKDQLDSLDCSIHVRRGDYVNKYLGTYTILDMDYYNEAMNLIKADNYCVFSDDLRWCANKFPQSVTFVSDYDYIELFMMAHCSHNIIANSSFSWWGAYLNQNPYKKIVAPHSWYSTYKYDSKDTYCKNWIIV